MQKNPIIGIKAGKAQGEFPFEWVTDAAKISPIVEKFRAKYGESGIKLYSKLDVALIAHVR